MPLPGVKTTILDRFYNQARTDGIPGPLIAVVAKRSLDDPGGAPDLSPYGSTDEKDIIDKFGENSQCHKAYYELTTSGAPRVTIIPLPSDTAFDQANGAISSTVWDGLYPAEDLFDSAIAGAEAARADILLLWGAGSTTLDWDDVADPATPGGGADDYFYADNDSSPANSWAQQLAVACNNITLNSHPIIGVIGVKGIVGHENPTPGQVATAMAFTNLVDKASITPAVGHLINVVAGEVHVLGAPTSWGFSSAASAYAASIARLDAWSSTTGKNVFNVDRVRYNPSRTQLETMTSKGLVPIQIDFSRSPRWVDGLTFAADASDYVRLTTVRIVFDAVRIVRRISQNYIGEAMSIDRQQAFQTQISSGLQSMQKVGALNNADYRVVYAPSQNKASVDLALTPAFELREVYISVSVNF